MKKPEKVWMLIATTIALISCQLNRAEALMLDWNVTGDQNPKMTGPMTAKSPSPVQENNVYKNAGATGGETNSDGRDSHPDPNDPKTTPGEPAIIQQIESDPIMQNYNNCMERAKKAGSQALQILCGPEPHPPTSKTAPTNSSSIPSRSE